MNERQVCSKKEHTALNGKKYIVNIYNLDMIISVGYRAKYIRGIYFRKWTNKILKEYLLRGYVTNESFSNSLVLVNYIQATKRVEMIEEKSIILY